jgi:Ice-binding-like
MRLRIFFVLVLVFVLPLLAVSAYADILGTAASYAALAGTQVTNPATNLADTVVLGDMGATSCTGFAPGVPDVCTSGFGTVSGATNLGTGSGTAAYGQAMIDFGKAYTALANTPFNHDFTGSCLGTGVGCINNLAPGVYSSTLSATLLHGTLTLAGDGNPNDLWIFQTAFGLTTDSGSSVLVSGTGTGAGLYWQVGSKATLGSGSSLLGNFLAGTAIEFDPGAQITCGRAFGKAEVTFAGNLGATVSGTPNQVGFAGCNGFNSGTIIPGGLGGKDTVGGGTGGAAVPEPGTFALLSSGLALGLLKLRKQR